MSVKASKPELIRLIYRHLKEHGFHSAAQELQMHIPQVKTKISLSLLDIYNSWLNDSKRKKGSDSVSKPQERERTPAKGKKITASTTPSQNLAEEDSSSDGEELSQSVLPQITPMMQSKSTQKAKALSSPKKPQKSTVSKDQASVKVKTPTKKSTATSKQKSPAAVPAIKASPAGTTKKNRDKANKQIKSTQAKRKKIEGKSSDSAIKRKKSKTPTEDKDGGDDSDSDSSLDVEKWKKLFLQMTEADIAKMDIINALDSSAPQPKKKRVRNPRAKPPPKTNAPIQQTNGTKENNENVDRVLTETPTKSSKPKKISSKKTAPGTSSATPSQEQNFSTVENRPGPSTSPLSKQTPVKEKRKAVTASEDKSDERSGEPKKKKKKEEEASKLEIEGKSNVTAESGKDKDSKGKKKNKNLIIEQDLHNQPVEEKKTKGSTEDGKNNETEKGVLEKSSKGGHNNKDISESVIQEKKAKKKKQEKTDSEEKTEQIAERKKPKKKIKPESSEDSERKVEEANSEQVDEQIQLNSEKIVVKNKEKKKKRADSDEVLEKVETEHSEQIVVKNKEKKKKRADGDGVSEKVEETENSEQIVVKNKEKKKKKADRDEEADNSEPIAEAKKNRKEAEDAEETSEQMLKEKKAKKKKKEKENPDEESLDQIVEEKKRKKKDKTAHFEELSEQVVEERPDGGDRSDEPDQITEVTKKKKRDSSLFTNSVDAELLPPPNPETPSLPREKKKKVEVSFSNPPAFVHDTTVTQTIQTPTDVYIKRKKICHDHRAMMPLHPHRTRR